MFAVGADPAYEAALCFVVNSAVAADDGSNLFCCRRSILWGDGKGGGCERVDRCLADAEEINVVFFASGCKKSDC